MRGIAALLVVVGHHNDMSNTSRYWQNIVASLAVFFFFSLSGFLLTYLAVREYDQKGRFDGWAFWIRRMFRIWPLYLVAVLVVASLPYFPLVRVPVALIQSQAIQLLFVTNWSAGLRGVGGWEDRSGGLGILWSIGVEEQFYLGFALCMGWLLRQTARRRLLVLIGMLAFSMTWRLFASVVIWPMQANIFGPIPPAIYFVTFSHLDEFVAGGLAGWLLARRRLPSVPWLGVLALPALAGVCWLYGVVIETPNATAGVWCYPVIAAAFGLTLFWVAQQSGRWMTWPLRLWPLRSLGAISYGVYVWHLEAVGVFRLWIVDAEWSEWVLLGVHMLTAIVLATITYWLFERWCTRLGHRIAGRVARRHAEYSSFSVPPSGGTMVGRVMVGPPE